MRGRGRAGAARASPGPLPPGKSSRDGEGLSLEPHTDARRRDDSDVTEAYGIESKHEACGLESIIRHPSLDSNKKLLEATFPRSHIRDWEA